MITTTQSVLCGVCQSRKAEMSAPRGWNAAENRPATAPECAPCAFQDGWPLFVEGDPEYFRFSPSDEDVEALVREYRSRKARV